MRLIECYISGFGTLREQRFSFQEGLSAFIRPNGTGKSTLAAFLKAMLYGMPSYKRNAKSFEDRQHYLPFDGGAYGGSLTLEYQGETYCITRRFDPKSETKDAYSVTCDGKPTDALGKVPGRAIFQVDSDSFERTAFFTADPGELGATTGIAGRLQSFVDGAQASDFDSAYKALEDAAKALQSSRGQNSRIPQQQSLIRALEQELLSREQLSQALEADYRQRQTITGQIQAEEDRLAQTRADQTARERWQVYAGLRRDAESKALRLEALQKNCGSRQPEPEEVETLAQCRKTLTQTRAALHVDTFPAEKQRQLTALRSRYPKGIPGSESLDKAQQAQQVLDEPPAPPETPGKRNAVLPVLGIALALGGVALSFFQLFVGIALAVTGLGLGLWGMVAGSKAKARYRRLVREQTARQGAALAQLSAQLGPYGLKAYLPQLRSDGFLLENLEAECSAARSRRSALNEQLDASVSQARAIFERLGLSLSEPPEEDISQLFQNLDALAPLSEDAAAAREKAENYRREYALEGVAPALTADPRQLEDGLSLRRRQLANLDRQILDTEYRLEDLSDCHIRLEEAREREAELLRRYRLLSAARDCLAEAEQALKAQHIDPVRSRFDVYADALAETLGAKVGLSKDFGLYLLEKGGQYPDRHFSAGQRAVVALCLRLALLDNLYPGDKPPIILDDPFVFLDESHLDKAKALVEKLSQQWQILYFTCHESRSV